MIARRAHRQRGALSLAIVALLLTSCVPAPLTPLARPGIGVATGPVTSPVAPTPGRATSAPLPARGTAASVGTMPGPQVATLRLTRENAQAALTSFRTSCPSLLARADTSGLTRNDDWRPACVAAAAWPTDDALAFFATMFETAQVSDGATYVTGYYEPEIAGVRVRRPGFDTPIYAAPPDLVHARPGEAPPLPTGAMPAGRYDAQGRFVPYWDRAAIEDGALAGKGLEIAWAADPIEFYFLQVQGSGRLRAPDGSIMRIGYAAQNGYPYTDVGTILAARGLIGDSTGQYRRSMQGVIGYLHAHPAEADTLLRQNQSWVFFRELTGDGPIGALGIPVIGHSSLAADPLFVPLGAPVWLDGDRDEANGLWIAQDTGGAIKGANRFDTFWGAGADARRIAGGMSARGQALVLLPTGTLARLSR